jgi:hypothetical protein
MKKIVQLFILFIVTCYHVSSQEIRLGFQTGLGTWSMIGLKGINDLVSQSIPFDTKLVANFPPYYYYQPSISKIFDEYGFGLIYNFQSTGSRLSGKDYSGEYHFDMNVHSSSLGIYGEFNMSSDEKFRFTLYGILGVDFSSLTINEYLSVMNALLSNQSDDFKAINFFFEPGISFSYPLKSFSVGINMGYLTPFGNGAFYTGDDQNNKLFNTNTQQAIKPEWIGLRAGLSVFYTFK